MTDHAPAFLLYIIRERYTDFGPRLAYENVVYL